MFHAWLSDHLINFTSTSDHVKQADQSWGAPTGSSEWNDEKAGEEIAKAEEQAAGWDNEAAAPSSGWGESDTKAADGEATDPTTGAVAAPLDEAQAGAEVDPEDSSRSYADYLAEQAEKKMKLGSTSLTARKANEGSKQDKKWAQAKALNKDEEEDEYIAGKGEKARRERQRKEKQVVDVDFRYSEPNRGGERGRGRGRGGEYRGERGRGGGRGRGEGFRGRGDGYRGGRGGRDGASVNVSDENAFPSLKS